MEQLFSSTVGHWPEPIDCRQLSLKFDFYFFTMDQVLSMSKDIMEWQEERLSNQFLIRRFVEKKASSKEKAFSIFSDHLQSKNYVDYTTNAMVISPLVYNATTLQNYQRKVQQNLSYISSPSCHHSNDYPDYWNSLFGDKKCDNETIRRNILRIFREENRIMNGGYIYYDAQGWLHVQQYANHPHYFYGSFLFDFSVFCLGSHVDEMAERFAQFAEYLSNTYVKLNARVMLQPPNYVGWRDPYMSLFGGGKYVDDSHEDANCKNYEWYSTYYLRGVEWFNVISPLAGQYLTHIKHNFDTLLLRVVAKKDGRLILRSKKRISLYNIPDALAMKRLLLPALYPGMRSWTFRTLFNSFDGSYSFGAFPRCDWAIIPVFESEISIVGNNYLVFTAITEQELLDEEKQL